MPQIILTALLILAAAALCGAAMLAKSEMELLDQNGDPIEQDEQP